MGYDNEETQVLFGIGKLLMAGDFKSVVFYGERETIKIFKQKSGAISDVVIRRIKRKGKRSKDE